MKILKATHLGMCFGVRDAIAIARREAQREPVTVFGPLVHNPVVVSDLARKGVRIAETPERVGTGTVLISAHGASERARRRLARRARRIIEATCPLVRRAHEALAELVADGCHPVVIGQRGHVEVRGLTEDLPECDVILTEDDVNALRERPRFGVVAQTTQPLERVERLVAALRRRFPRSEVRVRNTVCRPTRDRQQAAIELARRCTVVVVLGGANSNNTRELAATCSRFCDRVHRVASAADLRPEWFQADDVVGLTAGTSTPDRSIAAVERWLRRRAAADVRPVWTTTPAREPARALTAVAVR
jgi:4-hydroxy-3-methylbut-2-enyl diphosphate reductase